MILALVMFAALLLPSSAAFAQNEVKVTRIVISGNQNINKETIESAIKLAPGAEYSKEATEKDRAAINALGYFSAVSVRTEETPEGLSVIYDVVENPVVKGIEVIGSEPISDETIKGLLRTKTNQVLNYSTLNTDIDAIQRYYRDEGYMAYVTEDIGIDRETGVLTIPILVHVVEDIDIVGNKKTRNYVLIREMKTRPGQVFNMKQLRNDIARLYNLDVFEHIETPKIEPGSNIGKVAVAIPVTEKKTGNVGIGVGYSSRSKLVGRAELTETNFRGRGQGLTLLWETGTSNGLGGSSSYEVGFHEPWIDKHHTSLSVNVFNKLVYRFASTPFNGDSDIDGDAYNERRKGATLGLSRPLNEVTRAFITMRGETVETSDFTATTATRYVASDGDIRSGTLRLVNNTRDFDMDPADGWYRSVSLELGNADVTQKFFDPATETLSSEPLSGPYRKLQFDIRRYWSKGGRKVTPTDKRTTFAVRLLGGLSNGDLPFFEQFFVGGSETLRGYREDRFWGDKMLVANIEYRRPVTQGLTGVLFADYGDAWGSNTLYDISDDLPQHNSFEPSLGVGVGLRVNTPIGNLRFDYGIGDDGARTHFSIGHAF